MSDGEGRRSAPTQPTPADEPDRLAAVQATGLLDTPPDAAFDDLVALASEIMGTPIALITLVDADRQWFKAKLGLDVAETPRAAAFCGWAIAEPDDLFVVDDATVDERFSANPLVTGEPGIRFYAGAVVRDAAGLPLGTICGIDRAPRELRPEQAVQLRMLARQVGRLIELHHLGGRLARSEARAQAIADRAVDIVVVLDGAGTIVYVNDTMTDILGWETADRIGTNAFDLIHPDDLVVVSGEFARLLADPEAEIPPLVIRVARADGGWIAAEIQATNLLDHPDVGGIVANLRDVTYRQDAEARVERGERRLAVAQRVAGMGSWELDVVTHTHHWSQGLYELCGLDPEAEPSDEAWTATMRPDDRAWIADAVVEAVEKDAPFSFRRRLVRTDGTERWVFVQGEVELDGQGEPVWIRGTLVDIHDQVAAEEALTSERRFLATVLDTMEDSIVACDADGRLLLFNPAAQRLHGLTADQALPPEEWPGHYDLFQADGTTPLATDQVPLLRALTSGSVTGEEIVVRRKGGSPRLMCCTGQSISTEDDVQLGAVVVMRDVTEERANEQQLRQLADHDPLTGLANRATLAQRLQVALAAAEPVTLLFIDLDGFKAVNDDHGHAVGDEVLAAVGKRLAASVKSGDTTARMGGDEFVVVLRGVSDPAQARAIAERVEVSLSRPIEVSGRLVAVGASVGTAISGPGETDGEALLARADRAMYEVKQHKSR